jgi:topoisomerase-4 subunit A
MLIFDISELPMLPKGKGNKIINIPKPKLLAGEESMNFVCLLSEASTLQIHSGKRFMSLKLKDLENYISTRAKRGMMLPQGYRKVDSVIEINAEDEVAPE